MYHSNAHFGTDKTYELVKERYFWPSMYKYIKTFVTSCSACGATKCDTAPGKAPLLPLAIPEALMQFISIDIATRPVDDDSYRYFLLIGDIFSKFIDTAPLIDHTATSVLNALSTRWILVHGAPLYLLSDQGSNVDGSLIRAICDAFGIEKRRSLAYHSQGAIHKVRTPQYGHF